MYERMFQAVRKTKDLKIPFVILVDESVTLIII